MEELCKLTTHCRFGELMDEALHDCIVSGLCTLSIQKQLLTEEDLCIMCWCHEAIAQSMESAQASSMELQANKPLSGNLTVNYAHQSIGRATNLTLGNGTSNM